MTVATHNDLIEVSITRSPAARSATFWRTVLLLVPQASNSLGGGRRVSYPSYASASAARTAGTISAATLIRLRAMFDQTPRIAGVVVARVDLAASETYTQALMAAAADGIDWWCVCCETRNNTTIRELAEGIEEMASTYEGRQNLIAQSSDAGCYGTLPVALSEAADATDRLSIIYHPTDVTPMAEAWAGSIAARSPIEYASPWVQRLQGAGVAASALSQVQLAAARDTNSVNVAAPFGTDALRVFPGQTLSGRDGRELLAGDWLAWRAEVVLQDLLAARANLGLPIPLTPAGQDMVVAALSAILSEAVSIGHLEDQSDQEPPLPAASSPALSDDDFSSRRIRAEMEGTHVGTAIRFTLGINFQSGGE